MNTTVEQWEASVAELWRRVDSFGRRDGVAAMRELAEACRRSTAGQRSNSPECTTR
ncbi:MAG: hypothetical protein L0H74_08900 [Brachybacterium sp.]|nr:hypothetical protein [Brachybacterium sp.]MDN5900172.1 hypothetical protein [Brachybacterium sp.]